MAWCDKQGYLKLAPDHRVVTALGADERCILALVAATSYELIALNSLTSTRFFQEALKPEIRCFGLHFFTSKRVLTPAVRFSSFPVTMIVSLIATQSHQAT